MFPPPFLYSCAVHALFSFFLACFQPFFRALFALHTFFIFNRHALVLFLPIYLFFVGPIFALGRIITVILKQTLYNKEGIT